MDAICWRCHEPVTILNNGERLVAQPCDKCIDQAFQMGHDQGVEDCTERAKLIVDEEFSKMISKITGRHIEL